VQEQSEQPPRERRVHEEHRRPARLPLGSEGLSLVGDLSLVQHPRQFARYARCLIGSIQ